MELLTKKSYSLTYGARNLRRTIQKELEDPMATKIIDSYEHPITQVKATVEDGCHSAVHPVTGGRGEGGPCCFGRI